MRRLTVSLLMACAPLVACAGQAADTPAQCAHLTTAAERIVCYDKLFPPSPGSQSAAEAQAPVVSTSPNSSPASAASQPPPAPIASTETDDQAGEGWSLGLFDRAPPYVAESSIKAIYRRENQPMAFLLANEQIWLQDSQRQLPIREGDAVTIKNGTFGGYFLTTEGGTKTRVRRVK